jgi:hypothetical protein
VVVVDNHHDTFRSLQNSNSLGGRLSSRRTASNKTRVLHEQIGSMTFRTFKARVPDRVLEAAKEAGGSVTSIPGEGLCCVRCEYGDACYHVLIEWVLTTHNTDPCVTVTFAPPPRVLGTELCPPLEIVYPILIEASSIVHHCASL